jgi:hypothetical protein
MQTEYHKAMGDPSTTCPRLLDDFWKVLRFFVDRCSELYDNSQSLTKENGLLILDFDTLEKDVHSLENRVEELKKQYEEEQKEVVTLKQELSLKALLEARSKSGSALASLRKRPASPSLSLPSSPKRSRLTQLLQPPRARSMSPGIGKRSSSRLRDMSLKIGIIR